MDGTWKRGDTDEPPEEESGHEKKHRNHNDGKSPGQQAEGEVTEALRILQNDPDSAVLSFIHASQIKYLDSLGIDFLVFLKPIALRLPCAHTMTTGRFLTLPLQVKRSRGSKRSWKNRNNRIREHYERYPHIAAISVDMKSPRALSRHIENLIRRVLRGAAITPFSLPQKNPRT